MQELRKQRKDAIRQKVEFEYKDEKGKEYTPIDQGEKEKNLHSNEAGEKQLGL